jgi:hypothetical protein
MNRADSTNLPDASGNCCRWLVKPAAGNVEPCLASSNLSTRDFTILIGASSLAYYSNPNFLE